MSKLAACLAAGLVVSIIAVSFNAQTSFASPIANGCMLILARGSSLAPPNGYVFDPENKNITAYASQYPGSFSPDGTKVLHTTTNYGVGKLLDIFVTNSDGSGSKQLTDYAGGDGFPVWSPAGDRIAFGSQRGNDTFYNVFVMDADGTNVVQLTNTTGIDSRPVGWSPDGAQIAYATFMKGRDEIGALNVMKADGSDKMQLTDNPRDSGAQWSPDSSKIIFVRSDASTGASAIFLINRDSTGLKHLVGDASQPAQSPDWSPDGTGIVFSSNVNNNIDIYVMNAGGSGVTRLTSDPANDSGPVWSPDGTKIGFTSGREGNDRVYMMNPDGTGQTSVNGNPDNPDPIGPGSGYTTLVDWGLKPVSGQDHMLTIKSVDIFGNPLGGVWTTVRTLDGTLVKSGFTPFAFTGDAGAAYKVSVANYGGKVFTKWQDDASAGKIRIITLASDTALAAVYDMGDSQRGYTSLTYTGAAEQPDLTVNAVSLDGNRTLHMWTIIDPQSSDSSETTYKIYASSYLDRVFDHWSDGNKDRIRTLTIDEDMVITAFYRTG